MTRINIDFSSILQPIKDAQNELTKLLTQMQEASKMSQGLSSGMRSGGSPRFSSIQAAGNYTKNMKAIHGDNVIQMPGVPHSNLDPSQHVSSSVNNPIAQAARANVSSNLDPVGIARAYNSNAEAQRSAPARGQLIAGLTGSSDTSLKYIGESLKESSQAAAKAMKEVAAMQKTMLDANGRLIKDNTDAQKKLADLTKEANKLQEQSNALEAEANDAFKNSGGGGGSGGSGGRGGIRGVFDKMGGLPGLSNLAAAASVGLQAFGQIKSNDVFAELQARGSNIQAQQALYHQQMSAAAPMSGRDILRNYGNLMAPDLVGSNSYIGTGGLGRAQNAALNIQNKELSSSRLGALSNLATSTLAGIGMGAGAGAAFAGLGAVPGAVLGGIMGLGRGIMGLSDNKYIQSQGGLAGYIPGAFGGESQRQRNLFEANQRLQSIQMAQQIQNQELDRPEMERRARGLDIRTAVLSAQLSGTSLVGGRSANGLNMMAGINLGKESGEQSLLRQNAQGLIDSSIGVTGSKNVIGGGGFFSPGTETATTTGITDSRHYNQGVEQLKKLTKRTESIADRAARNAADILMNPAEYGQMTNMWQSYGGKESEARGLAKLRFAGVGSAEQLGAQMFGLQSSTNKPISLEDFKKTLSEGVSNGFSSAPLMQAFMGTLTQLSQSMGVNDVNKVGGELGMLSSSISVTGKGGMRSLREAAQAMSSVASYSGQVNGPVGMMKTLAGASSGMTIQSGLSVANTMNSSQLMEARDAMQQMANSKDPAATLAQLEKSGKVTTDTARMIRLNKGNYGQAATALTRMADASTAQARGMINLGLGGNLSKLTDEFKAIVGKGGKLTASEKERLKEIEASVSAATEGSGIDRNAALLMLKDSAFSGMSETQKTAAMRSLRGSGSDIAKAQAEGEAKAKSNTFLAAQVSLNARLGTEAAIGAGGFASQEMINDAVKGLNTDEAGLKKRLGIKDSQKLKAEDISGLMAQGAGQVNTVNIGGFATSALNQFGTAMSMALGKAIKSDGYTDSSPGVRTQESP